MNHGKGSTEKQRRKDAREQTQPHASEPLSGRGHRIVCGGAGERSKKEQKAGGRAGVGFIF